MATSDPYMAVGENPPHEDAGILLQSANIIYVVVVLAPKSKPQLLIFD